MQDDSQRLVIPERIATDPNAMELVSAWVHDRNIAVMTRTGTPLDQNAGIWGKVLVAQAHNIALLTEQFTGVKRIETLRVIKEVLDQQWYENLPQSGEHYPRK